MRLHKTNIQEILIQIQPNQIECLNLICLKKNQMENQTVNIVQRPFWFDPYEFSTPFHRPLLISNWPDYIVLKIEFNNGAFTRKASINSVQLLSYSISIHPLLPRHNPTTLNFELSFTQ